MTKVTRRIDVAIIVVKLRYSRRFSSKVAPFLGVMSRQTLPCVDRGSLPLGAQTSSFFVLFCIELVHLLPQERRVLGSFLFSF